MKKKILIFQPTIGSYRIDFVNALSKQFDVSVYIEDRIQPNTIFDVSELDEKLLIHPNKLKKIFKLKKRIFYGGYFKAIREWNPDIVLVSEFGVDAIMAIIYKTLFNKNYKIISICDDSYDMLANDADFTYIHKFMRRTITPFLDNLVLVEPKSVEWYQKKYGKGIYFPIISDENILRSRYEKSLMIADQYVKKYFLEDKKVILYVGRLVEIKNVQSLIKAFDCKDFKDSVLVIVGDGDYSSALHDIAQKSHNIIFTGRLTGNYLYAWYNLASVFVLPSLIEPFGAVTNEALIGGCLSLVSNKAGSRALIKEGVNGYTIDPNDVDDIRQKLKKSLTISNSIEPYDLKVRPSKMMMSFKDEFARFCSEIMIDL